MRRLTALLAQLDLPMATRGQASAQIEQYVDLLKRWNRTHNLVAKRDLADAKRLETRHLIDSVALYPFMTGAHIDIGSGGGLPAIPLAILRPDAATTLVERSTKKCRFLRQVALELELGFEVMECDVRTIDRVADVVTARAVAPLDELWPMVRGVLAPGGVLLLQTTVPVTAVDPVIDAVIEPSVEVNSRFVTVVRQRP